MNVTVERLLIDGCRYRFTLSPDDGGFVVRRLSWLWWREPTTIAVGSITNDPPSGVPARITVTRINVTRGRLDQTVLRALRAVWASIPMGRSPG